MSQSIDTDDLVKLESKYSKVKKLASSLYKQNKKLKSKVRLLEKEITIKENALLASDAVISRMMDSANTTKNIGSHFISKSKSSHILPFTPKRNKDIYIPDGPVNRELGHYDHHHESHHHKQPQYRDNPPETRLFNNSLFPLSNSPSENIQKNPFVQTTILDDNFSVPEMLHGVENDQFVNHLNEFTEPRHRKHQESMILSSTPIGKSIEYKPNILPDAKDSPFSRETKTKQFHLLTDPVGQKDPPTLFSGEDVGRDFDPSHYQEQLQSTHSNLHKQKSNHTSTRKKRKKQHNNLLLRIPSHIKSEISESDSDYGMGLDVSGMRRSLRLKNKSNVSISLSDYSSLSDSFFASENENLLPNQESILSSNEQLTKSRTNEKNSQSSTLHPVSESVPNQRGKRERDHLAHQQSHLEQNISNLQDMQNTRLGTNRNTQSNQDVDNFKPKTKKHSKKRKKKQSSILERISELTSEDEGSDTSEAQTLGKQVENVNPFESQTKPKKKSSKRRNKSRQIVQKRPAVQMSDRTRKILQQIN